ncbi:hypothetical protein G0Q06_12655 [Puniceicoccales bacterium CK1056]|uniref:Uncharacterized protein n=1 Tax=Oceanipulchritudo coccoides TaxID=2706888 RepID=A0A6B2M2X1_9BACT|nr:hypothetical protein [Oceanipulchritudo coccoides]NDV63308.1 hypothetical protein [Oceanipulchritudo coccoides]
MNKHELIESLLFAGLRLMAVVLFLTGGLQLVFQIAEAWYRFDPNYLGEFLFSTIFRPVVVILVAAALCLSAGWMSRTMAKPFSKKGS